MSDAIWFISYQLKKNVSEADFLRASERCCKEVLSKQKGFISWEVLRQGDAWVDLVRWESVEDAKKGEMAGAKNPAAHEFYAFIDMKTCKLELYGVEKSY